MFTIKNIIFDNSELAKTFNSYFEKTEIELGIKEYENFDMTFNSRYEDDVDIAINKYKSLLIKTTNKNVSFKWRLNFKDTSESDIWKEFSNFNSKKAEIFGNIPTKVPKESSNICNAVLRNVWSF